MAMYSVGVDVGGTNLAAGVLSDQQELLLKDSVPFPGAERCMESVQAMNGLIDGLLKSLHLSQSEISSIGLAVPGSIDYDQKRVINAHNLGYHDFPLAELLNAYFPETPIEIENDANAAALAEYYCGAFRSAHTGVLITLGTGVGGGMILDDKLFIGGCKHGFELGHMIIVDGGERCTCGNYGCLEAYCSATALIRDGQRAAKTHPDSLINRRSQVCDGHIDAKLVIDCAKEGDETAMTLFRAYIEHLGSGIANIINTIDPEVIAIGGGICNAGEFLFAPLRENAHPKAFYDTHARIVPAETGNDAGIIGAAMLHQHKR